MQITSGNTKKNINFYPDINSYIIYLKADDNCKQNHVLWSVGLSEVEVIVVVEEDGPEKWVASLSFLSLLTIFDGGGCSDSTLPCL